jgi:hypothetical protein
MNREELIAWKERIYQQQRQARLDQKNQPEQKSLFDLYQPNKVQADAVDPLRLKLYPADFYRSPRLAESQDMEGCIYFLVDHFSEIILYIGETKLSVYRRWIRTHYAKDYTLNYIEAHRQHELECAVCSAFCLHVPPDKKILHSWESELIFKWRPPFNRQMWKIYGQPFKRF